MLLLVKGSGPFADWLSVTEVYCISITGLQDHHHQLFQVFTRLHTPTHRSIHHHFYTVVPLVSIQSEGYLRLTDRPSNYLSSTDS